MKKIIEFFKLLCHLKERMTEIDETMALKDVTEIYAKYVCKMNGWSYETRNGYTMQFCEVEFSFMNGYNKALADNGLKFNNGLVVKREISDDMPIGALQYYEADIREDSNKIAAATLRKILKSYGCFDGNINTIVRDYHKQLSEENKKKITL